MCSVHLAARLCCKTLALKENPGQAHSLALLPHVLDSSCQGLSTLWLVAENPIGTVSLRVSSR